VRSDHPQDSAHQPSPANGRVAVRDREALRESATVERSQPEHPSPTDAVERVIDAGQRLVTERIELARLDAEDAITRAIGRGVLVVLMGLFAFSGWWAAMAAVVILLTEWMPLPESLALVGAVHVAVGTAAIVYLVLQAKPAGAVRESGRA
jgi:hypothetical protein